MFSPVHPDQLISGSTDATLSMFKLDAPLSQDDSLQYTLSEGSVFKLGFFGPRAEYVYALTHYETLSLHRFHDAKLVAAYGDVRNASTCAEKRSSYSLEYAIDCQYQAAGSLYLVGGSRSGRVCVESVHLDRLEPMSQLSGNHASTISAVRIDAVDGTMITSAEDGTVCLWHV